jgi:N-acetyl sugar amidotransferase
MVSSKDNFGEEKQNRPIEVTWCKNCLNMSTRPRITFDNRGWCNACQWMEEKKTLDWGFREKELNRILSKHRSSNGKFDCVVPVSGGKDGSYVAYKLKHEYGMNPLAVTIKPPLTLELGDNNLKNFIEHGYDHIHISPGFEAMRTLNKTGFIEMGFPYYGWLTAILTAVIRMSMNMNISMIFYGESGEVEYGGSLETKNTAIYDIEYMERVYLSGGHEKVLKKSGLNDSSLHFFKFPEEQEYKDKKVDFAHWSHFENWDPYRNYLVAKEHCGLEEAEDSNRGTFTNFSQNDQALYSLHAYMMYLKLGFGRATQDAGIEIRRGAMTRDQAINLVKLYDGHYPDEFIDTYLEYYQMSMDEFDAVIDQWANKDLFEKVNGRWKPMFCVE